MPDRFGYAGLCRVSGKGTRMAAGLANRNISFGMRQDRLTDWLRDLKKTIDLGLD